MNPTTHENIADPNPLDVVSVERAPIKPVPKITPLASVDLPGDRRVAVMPHKEDGVHLYFHKIVGGLLIKTELGLSREAAQALVNCLAIQGIVPSKVMCMTLEIPTYELKGKVWMPVGETVGVDPETVEESATLSEESTKGLQEHDHW